MPSDRISRSPPLIATSVATPSATFRSTQPLRANDCRNGSSFLWLRKTPVSFLSAFPMFVPSLSW
eukprot:COSAG06_NODE_1815_length_8303_cov_3.031936_14_plen_65_part_00